MRAGGISGCGQSACVAAEQHMRSLRRLLTKTRSECSFMSFGGGHHRQKTTNNITIIITCWKKFYFFLLYFFTNHTNNTHWPVLQKYPINYDLYLNKRMFSDVFFKFTVIELCLTVRKSE